MFSVHKKAATREKVAEDRGYDETKSFAAFYLPHSLDKPASGDWIYTAARGRCGAACAPTAAG